MDRYLDTARHGPMYLHQERAHYIENNPVKAGPVTRAEGYPWSSVSQRTAGAETSLGAAG